MTIYDAAMAAVLIGGMVRGAWRGITWQLASIGSLVLGYLFAYPISAQIGPLLPGPAEASRALSMAAAYAVVSGGVFAAAWMVRGAIHRLKFDAFDRHLGMMLGGLEGAGVGILLTLLLVSIAPNTRGPIFDSPSGRVVGGVLDSVGPVLPVEVRRVLKPFWDEPGATVAEAETEADAAAADAGAPAADSPSPIAPRPAAPRAYPVVAETPAPPQSQPLDAAVRPAAGRRDAVPAPAPAPSPAQAQAQAQGPASTDAAPAEDSQSLFDSFVSRGKQMAEQAVVESLDADPDQKAATFRELVDKDKKRFQDAASQIVGGVQQDLSQQVQGRSRQVQGRVGRLQEQAVKARQKLERKIGDTIDRTIDQQLDRLGGLPPAPEKTPR